MSDEHADRCMAVCLDCGDEIEAGAALPFFDATERDEWLTAHVGGTGHDVRRVEGWPHLGEAVRIARAQEGS